jgi:uncharacterized membrane protein
LVSREQIERLAEYIGDLESRLSKLEREAFDVRGDVARLREQLRRLQAAEAATVPAPEVTATPGAESPAPPSEANPPPLVPTPPMSIPAPPPIAADIPMDAPSPEASRGSLEERVALVWFARIGALVLLCGVAYLYSYAVDRNWIAPLGRCVLGALVGAGLIAGAELLKRSTNLLYVQVLFGLGLAFLYLSDYASYGFYSLLPADIALHLAAAITFLGGVLAARHRSEAILVFSLLGGFAAPVLLSTGQDRPLALFGYLIVLTSLSFAISLRERFRYSLWVAVAGAPVLFFSWYFKFFDIGGAYRTLISRWAALAGITGFLIEWLRVYQSARRAFGSSLAAALLLAVLLFGHGGYVALLYDWPSITAAVFIGLALVAVIAFALEDRGDLLGIPLIAGWCGLWASEPSRTGLTLPLVLTLVWAAAYFAGAVRDLFRRGAPASGSRLLVTSLAGIAAIALSIKDTDSDDGWLRAALVGLVAVADGWLGRELRRRIAARSGNVFIGQAFALGAFAAQFAFAHHGLTLVWVLLAVAVMLLAAHEAEGDWLAFGLLLWALTLARCLGLAAGIEPSGAVDADLLICAVGLFISWAAIRKVNAAGFQFWTPWLLTAGHALVLWATLSQLGRWLPALPDTLILGIYASLLVGGGFLFRERHHRYLGLVLFAITISKLVLWDIFHREIVFRILVLIGAGILLLGASFLYARYGRRLITLVREGQMDDETGTRPN